MEQQAILNGVDVDQLGKTVLAIQADPALAKAQFRTTTEWISGAHGQTCVLGPRMGGQEDVSRSTPFILESDEPPVLLGTNLGANAVEMVLAGLASCLTVGIAYNAAARGIHLEQLRVEITGDIDLQGFLGISESVRPGYQDICVRCHLKSPASESEILQLLEHVKKTSPVLDIVRHPTPVDVLFQRL